MNAFDVLIIALILAAAFFALRHVIKTRKSGGCSGCSGCSSSCSACGGYDGDSYDGGNGEAADSKPGDEEERG